MIAATTPPLFKDAAAFFCRSFDIIPKYHIWNYRSIQNNYQLAFCSIIINICVPNLDQLDRESNEACFCQLSHHIIFVPLGPKNGALIAAGATNKKEALCLEKN